jgi:hypothetical protein
MDTKGYGNIPDAFFEAITFLARALPKRSVPTWLELLFGAMLTRAGFVSEAWLAIKPKRHWTSYYKWLQTGKWSWVALGLQVARLALRQVAGRRCFLVIDDTVVCRCSRKAPESRFHHQHGAKANRPDFVLGQNWVTLALAISHGWRNLAVPVLSRLARTTGNSGKLMAARTLLRVVRPVLQGYMATLLIDSWYMRKPLLMMAKRMGYQVIGQARRDSALYLAPPPPTGKRGRPRKYGDKMTQELVARLPETRQSFFLYGAWHTVHYRSAIVLARFLDGQRVRAVWLRMEREDGSMSEPRLILCTDLSFSAARILLAYGKRWSIEDLFNQLKNRWGWKDTWQQSRQVLHRWSQILAASYALPQLLALREEELATTLANSAPWRAKQPVTAGRIRLGLARIFRNVDIRALWHLKSGKFRPPDSPPCADHPPSLRDAA